MSRIGKIAHHPGITAKRWIDKTHQQFIIAGVDQYGKLLSPLRECETIGCGILCCSSVVQSKIAGRHVIALILINHTKITCRGTRQTIFSEAQRWRDQLSFPNSLIRCIEESRGITVGELPKG